jgi:hypothetical protein
MGTSDLHLALLKSPQVRIWSTGIVVMVAMAILCGTRIRYTRLLVGGGGRVFVWSLLLWSDGSRVVYDSTYVISLVFKTSNRFKGDDFGSGGWSLRSRASQLSSTTSSRLRRESGDSDTSTVRRRLALAEVVIVRWSKDFNIIFYYILGYFVLNVSWNRFRSF